MKNALHLLAAAVFLSAVAAGVRAVETGTTDEGTGKAVKDTAKKTEDTAKAPKAKDTAKTPKKTTSKDRKIASFTDDAKKLKSLELTEEQQKLLGEAKAARGNAMEKWSQLNARSLEAAAAQASKAKGKSSAGARKRLEALKKSYEQGRQRIAAQHERKMFAILTPEQRGKWNAPILAADVCKELTSVKLDAEQKQKVLDLCQPPAQRLLEPTAAGKNPTIVKSLVGQTYARVLTAEQRKTYNEKKRPAKAKSTRRKSTGR